MQCVYAQIVYCCRLLYLAVMFTWLYRLRTGTSMTSVSWKQWRMVMWTKSPTHSGKEQSPPNWTPMAVLRECHHFISPPLIKEKTVGFVTIPAMNFTVYTYFIWYNEICVLLTWLCRVQFLFGEKKDAHAFTVYICIPIFSFSLVLLIFWHQHLLYIATAQIEAEWAHSDGFRLWFFLCNA